MPLKHLTRLGLTALLAAWCFDQLFWGKAPGISFFLFVLLVLGGGFFLTWGEGLRPPKASLALLAPVLFCAAMTFVRREPFTSLVNIGLTLGGLMVLAATWLGGRWLRYTAMDYILNGLRLVGDALFKPFQVFRPALWNTGARQGVEGEAGDAAQTGPVKPTAGRKTAASVLTGLLLALPLVALLSALLAEADPIFSRGLQDILRLFRLDQLTEYLFRLFYIGLGASLLSGVYLHALLSSPDERVAEAGKPGWTPLGWVEAATLLACVDALFVFFVAIQFRYFFGGRANITAEGFTYADYARRGFGELVVVAVISLLLFLALSQVTRRDSAGPRRAFSGLGIALVGLVTIILVSAFQRLLLYEAAYGFSRLRTYPHVFMVWLGALLLATAVLEGLGRMRYFALAAVLAGLGFGLTLDLLNVDAFIARQNVIRAVEMETLDTYYLVGLSDDAVPALFDLFASDGLPQSLKDDLGGVLACQAAQAGEEAEQPQSWPSFHLALERARLAFQAHAGSLAAYPVHQEEGIWRVTVGSEERLCEEARSFYD